MYVGITPRGWVHNHPDPSPHVQNATRRANCVSSSRRPEHVWLRHFESIRTVVCALRCKWERLVCDIADSWWSWCTTDFGAQQGHHLTARRMRRSPGKPAQVRVRGHITCTRGHPVACAPGFTMQSTFQSISYIPEVHTEVGRTGCEIRTRVVGTRPHQHGTLHIKCKWC